MRRSLLGLLTVVAAAGLLLVAGCQVFEPIGSLNVLSINNGNALRVDLSDFYLYFNKEDSVWEIVYQVAPDSVNVELHYAEIGAGLPTWKPYEALIKQAKVHFTSRLTVDEPPPYIDAVVGLSKAVPSDPTGKKVTAFYMTPLSSTWKQMVFGDYIEEEDPYFNDVVDLADATVTFSGYDSVAGHEVKAAGVFQVEFGNFYDDPSRFGK